MSDEKGPLPGHEHLTMHDQMRAMGLSDKPQTSPANGAVENQRRNYLENRIKYRASKANAGNEGGYVGKMGRGL